MNRRTFAAAAAAFSLSSCGDSARYAVTLAPWSLMRTPAGRSDPEGVPLEDYPAVARELGFEAIEQDNLHFGGAKPDPALVGRIRSRCDAAGVSNSLMLLGALGDIADVNDDNRGLALDRYRAWAEAAAELGCTQVRVVCADRKSGVSAADKRRIAVDGIGRLAESCRALDLELLIENHSGYTSDPDWLVAVIREVDAANCGILADFTEWRIERNPDVLYPDPYRGIEILAPLTRSVGAKATDFDAEGRETNTDYFRMLRILDDAGYRGNIAVEYFGEDLPRREGVTATRLLVEHSIAALDRA